METTERIVEAYVRYVKGWATIPNVRCGGQNEIDLIALDPVSLARYHIEVSISISQGFRKLTGKIYDADKAKQRVHQASQRRTIGFFRDKKFGSATVQARLADFGFEPGKYTCVVVSWGWDQDAEDQAHQAGIMLWDFRSIIQEIAAAIRGSREYFNDDTLRTLNLFIHAEDEASRMGAALPQAADIPSTDTRSNESRTGNETFWVYENWPNNCATVHLGSCAFCNDGRGMHGEAATANGEWLGPFSTGAEAWARAEKTKRREIRRCGVCSPLTDASRYPGRADRRLRPAPMIEFVDNESGYLSWIKDNPGGFVLNLRRAESRDYVILHRATCRSISTRKRAPGAYTERAYRKVCAATVAELAQAARREGRMDGSFSRRCGLCNP